jgi:hypothetical protein
MIKRLKDVSAIDSDKFIIAKLCKSDQCKMVLVGDGSLILTRDFYLLKRGYWFLSG